MAYIIAKYQYKIYEKVSREHAYGGYSCEKAGVPKYKVYESLEEIQEDITKLQKVNTGVQYIWLETYN